MNVFVDDIRFAPEKYDLVFRSAEDFIEWLNNNKETEIRLLSLDHDLGENVMDGTKLARTIVEMPNAIMGIQFHSDNFQGIKNMYSIFSSAARSGLMPQLRRLIPYKINTIDGVESPVKYFDARRS